MSRRKVAWLLGTAGVLGLGFLVLHAVVPAERTHPANVAPDAGSPWRRGEPVSGEPRGLFDGSSLVSDPWIVRDAGRYRMWMTLVAEPFTPRQKIGIAYAESADGRTWSSTGRHVLSPDPAGWDSLSVETACVTRRPGGGWFMYYTAPLPPEGGHHMTIGLAESDDGIAWKRRGAGPLLTGEYEWERPFRDGKDGPMIGGVLEPCVQYDPRARRYRMWYAGLGRREGEPVKYRIGYAESADGITWRRDPEPVFEPAAPGTWDDAITSHPHVASGPGGALHLFYFGSSAAQYQECEQLGGCAMTPGSLGHATSRDGRKWVRSSAVPILSPRRDGWDSWAVGGPCAIWGPDGWRLWYFGNPSHRSYQARIGTARQASSRR